MAKLNLKWTKTALAHLQGVSDFLVSQDQPMAARKMIEKILAGIEQVRVFPESGRTGRVKSTYELVIPGSPFILVYQKLNDVIVILAILHHAKKI